LNDGSIGHEGSPNDAADCIGSDEDSSSLQQFTKKLMLNPSYVPGRDFEHFWLWGAITYPVVGRIAGEVAVFDSQDPVVHDRSAVLCK
jgi:hypothetical protein